MRHLATFGGNAHRIAPAVKSIRENFDQPMRIEELAFELAMSVSSFHAHFKAVTTMSPLQFQKQLRLQEARRLMINDSLDAAEAGSGRLRRRLAFQSKIPATIRRSRPCETSKGFAAWQQYESGELNAGSTILAGCTGSFDLGVRTPTSTSRTAFSEAYRGMWSTSKLPARTLFSRRTLRNPEVKEPHF
jgi:AraC-like DNA-binding protein